MTRKAGVSRATLLMRIILTSSTATHSVEKFWGNKACAPFLSFLPEPARKSKKLAIAQVVSNKQTQGPLLLAPFSLQILVMEIKRGVPTTHVGSDSSFQSRIFPVGILRLLGPI